MGAFYVNYTIRNAERNSIVRALAKRRAFVSPEQNGSVVTFDLESDKQDENAIAKLAAQLSGQLRTLVLAVLLHDSDILWYQLYQAGKLIDEYNSTPDYWTQKREPPGPQGGDAGQLCRAFGCSEVAAVENILRAPQQTYPDAMGRHADLVRVLGLPEFAVGYGFEGIERGYLPKGLSLQDLIATA